MSVRNAVIGLFTALGCAAAYLAWRPADVGQSRYFADQTYHFQTLRALNDIAAGGADTSEILETIRHIRSGDPQGWFAAWDALGDRVARVAAETRDSSSRGDALLRAHTYYRTAEFFLPPGDPKRTTASRKNIDAFYDGLRAAGVGFERLTIAYQGDHHLGAVFYPAPVSDPAKPLIVFVGGFDSTLEELYFMLVAAAARRNYDVLTYEGPGQGQALREQGLTFTPEWEKPTKAVLDAFLAGHRRPQSIVLVGMSMGGYLAPRAAAFDERIDGVVAYDVLFDMGEIAHASVPRGAFWLRDHGLGGLVDALVRVKAQLSPGFAWSIANGMWTLGTASPLATVTELDRYTLAGVARQIRGDVLILAGAEDHFVPLSQVAAMEAELTGARSITKRVFDRASGGAEHCQLGAATLWHAALFDWLSSHFPTPTPK